MEVGDANTVRAQLTTYCLQFVFITAVTVAVIAAAVIVAAVLVAPSFALACNYTCVSDAYLISTEIRKLTDSITDIGAKIDINREGGNLLY